MKVSSGDIVFIQVWAAVMSTIIGIYFAKEWVAGFKTSETTDKVMSLLGVLMMIFIDYIVVTGH